jgi:hypothetical protein
MERREAPRELCDQLPWTSLAIGQSARRASGTQGFEGVGVPWRAGPCEGPGRLSALHRGTRCRRPHLVPYSDIAIDDVLDEPRRIEFALVARINQEQNCDANVLGL